MFRVALADGKGVMSLLRRRAGDEKVNVRKAALQALENIIKLESDGFNKEVNFRFYLWYETACEVQK